MAATASPPAETAPPRASATAWRAPSKTGRSSVRRAPRRCAGSASSSPAAAARGGARSTGGTASARCRRPREEVLMAALVWFTMGVAIWHFTIFVPDRFWGGIVGAFVGSAAGAVVSGAIAQIALGLGIGDTDLATAIYAVPGGMIGLGLIYLIGVRSGVEAEHI